MVLKNTGWSKLAWEGIGGRLLRQQRKLDLQERQGFLGSLGSVYCQNCGRLRDCLLLEFLSA